MSDLCGYKMMMVLRIGLATRAAAAHETSNQALGAEEKETVVFCPQI